MSRRIKKTKIALGLKMAFFLALGFVTSSHADTNLNPKGENTLSPRSESVHSLPKFEEYFQTQLKKELTGLGIDLNMLEAERKSIAAQAEKDPEHALDLARQFNAKYRPTYAAALQNLRISKEIAADLLIDTSTSTNMDDYLQIIRVSYRCNGLSLQLCEAFYPGRCQLQTFRQGEFGFPGRVNQRTNLYTLESNENGLLNMWKHNIDGFLSGQIGATTLVSENTKVCVQTRGHLEAFAVSTSLDAYANSHASSSAKLQLYVGPYELDGVDIFGSSVGIYHSTPIDRSNINVALGSEYHAYRSEESARIDGGVVRFPACDAECLGFSSVNLGGPTNNGLTNAMLPYPIEDQVWVTPHQAGAMKMYYQGYLGQFYRWGQADGRLRFVLDQIDVLTVPN